MAQGHTQAPGSRWSPACGAGDCSPVPLPRVPSFVLPGLVEGGHAQTGSS